MLKRIFFILFAAVACFGQGVIVPPQTALKSVNGVTMPIANATITVCAASTGGLPCSPALANALFKDAALTQPLSNPFTADANGNYNFAIAPGNYTVTVTASGFSGYSYQVSSGNGTAGSSVTLQTNGVNNSLQTLLNIAQGTGVQAANSGGQITISNTGVVSLNGRAGAVTAQANDYTWNQIGAGSNLNAQTMGTGGSLAPLNLGQVAGSQAWLAAGLAPPGSTGANSGGTILAAHGWLIQYTFQTAAGETLPSVLLSGNTTALTGGTCVSSLCTLTINAPTFPSGVTGWNVYACDTSPTPCTAPQLRAACQNLAAGVNCTFTAPQTTNTSGVPTTLTAWTQPPNVQAFNGSAGEIPSWFFPKADGNNYPWATVDWASCDSTNGPPFPCGTPTFTHRTFFNDTQGATQLFKNSFVSINHTSNIGTVSTNQDRAMGVYMQNPATDSTAHYSLTGLQVETDYNGTATITGSPDGEAAAGSFQMADFHTNAAPAPTAGMQAVRAQTFLESGVGSFGSCAANPCVSAIRAFMTDLSASGGSSNAIAALYARTWNSAGNHTAHQGFGLYLQSPGSTGRFSTANYGLYVEPWLVSTNDADRSFMFDGTSSTASKGVVQPALYLGGGMVSGQPALATNIINNSGQTSLPVTGSPQITGSLSTAQLGNLANPGNFTCSVAGGAGTNYSYTVIGVDGNGNTTANTSVCTQSAAATLNGSNFVTIAGTFQNLYGKGYARFDVYRTASSGSPGTTGFIGSMTCTGNTDIESGLHSNAQACSLNDTGLTASGTAPAANTTGGAQIAGDVSFTTGKGQHFNTQAANNDYAGTCTLTSATPSTCTVTFTRAYTAAPVCVATNQTTQANPIKAAPTTSNVVFTGPNTVTDVVAYICVGNPN